MKILFLLFCSFTFFKHCLSDNINLVRFEKNIIYDPLPEFYRENYKNTQQTTLDHWFWKKIKKGKKDDFEFILKDTYANNGIKINIYTLGKRETQHLVLFYLNNNYIGSIASESNKENVFKTETNTLKKGKNILSIRTTENIYLNWFEIDNVRSIPNNFNVSPKTIKEFLSNLKDKNNSCEYLIITHKKFKKDIEKLAKYRSKKYKVKIVDVQDIYNEFNFGNFSPNAIKDFLKYAYYNWSTPKIKYVLLVGDATVNVNWIKDSIIPTYTIPTLVGGDTATDNWFVDFDNDSIPEIAIGRLPVNNSQELRNITNKIIDYEQNKNKGIWQKKIAFFTADEETIPENTLSFVEKEAFKIFNMLVPYDFDISATLGYRGSNYNYIPSKFPQRFADKINDGYLTFAYFGHGDIEWLGPVLKDKKKYPVFENKNIGLLKDNKGKYPIMFLICCLVGGFDWPDKTTLSEKLLLKKDGGAIAVISSSRVSDPYGNICLLKELMQSVYKEKYQTIGEVILKAKENLIKSNDFLRQKIDGFADISFDYIAQEYPEIADNKELYVKLSKEYHNHLYNLLGDPALEINYPAVEIAFSTPKFAKLGEEIEIKGEVKNIKEGKVNITLECERDKIIYPIKKVNFTDNNWEKIIEENYKNANNKIILQKTENILDNKFVSKITIPKNLPEGKYIIKGYASNNRTDAIGSKILIIK